MGYYIESWTSDFINYAICIMCDYHTWLATNWVVLCNQYIKYISWHGKTNVSACIQPNTKIYDVQERF